MNETTEDELNQKRNMLYYNQLIMNERRAKSMHEKKAKVAKKRASFGAQKVDFKDYLFVPDEWEFVAYTIYVVGVPYITGAFFLFLFVANASWENFQLLNLNAFPIVWLIGYEIVSICLLIWIMILYLTYDTEDEF
ncbi:hypothetical protein [Sulfurimonas autotrophica]|uniref:Uncharacterized protein n=1 Tax=Sulfurimonas autotrophica (strain ATCC BAA-671 / DSM 16294 / JCM 11897 / OK10) TaxID=563040 RepID=E0UQY3_SULAO|nr:hypothetical protein [Sulfurimonas autotrophica]ADN08864.1 hypothetical protein Saut_0815 [Sulfurimonas autotrophica DSM 16294]